MKGGCIMADYNKSAIIEMLGELSDDDLDLIRCIVAKLLGVG